MLGNHDGGEPMNLRFEKAAPVAAGVFLFAMAGACGSSSEAPAGGGPTGTTSSGAGGSNGSSSTTGGSTSSSAGGTGPGSTTTGATGGSTTGTGGSGGSGMGGSTGGPKVDVPPGEPITAMPMTWTAVPVAGSICRDKMPTGFGVNIAPGSTKLLIYLEG